MEIRQSYAVICVSDGERARVWYSALFGRVPDRSLTPDAEEWHFDRGGVRVVGDVRRAGHSLLRLVVDDIESARAELSGDVQLGPAFVSGSSVIAQVRDPDGNLVTLAESGLLRDRELGSEIDFHL